MWYFQSPLIMESFTKFYRVSKKNTAVLPFYDDDKLKRYRNKFALQKIKKHASYNYISLPYPHKNHNFLLDVWELLVKDGYYIPLYVTIPNDFSPYADLLLKRIEKINSIQNVIINKGLIKHDEVLLTMYKCTHSIFVSQSETVGIGLIEASFMGNYVLAMNNTYVNYIVKPSILFENYCQNTVVDKTKNFPQDGGTKTTLIMKNEIKEFVNQLIK